LDFLSNYFYALSRKPLGRVGNKMKNHLTKSHVSVIFFVALLANLSFSLAAQQLDSNRIKTAYMINFIKHIEWPKTPTRQNFQLVIYKDQKFYQFLVRSLSQKTVKNKLIKVIYANSIKQLQTADVVYVPEQFNKELHLIANAIRGSETLLISDGSKEKHDVMINLVHNKGSAVISFEINKSNIVYEKLKMSAELLLLGGTELDVATLYRETEQAMQKTRQKDIELRTKLATQNQQLKNSAQRLKKSQLQLKNSIKETAKQKIDLRHLKNDVDKKQQLLQQQQQKLEKISAQFQQTTAKLMTQQQILSEKEQKNQQMLKRVAENKTILAQQNQQLSQHRLQLQQQDQELLTRKQTIKSQKGYISTMLVLIIIAVAVSILVVFFFIKNKKTTRTLTKTLSYLENTQEQLIQSEKMASLGGLVAGVAHEINTPLSIAITSNSLVLDDTSEVKQKIANCCLSKSRMAKHIEKVEQSLSMSEKALERVKILLANFKQVAADQAVDDHRKLNLAQYIEEVMMTLSVEMKKNEVNYQFSGETEVEITTYPGAFAQILTNLVNNSIRHGFEQRGSGNISIALHTNNSRADEYSPEQEWAVKIIYRDDGVGMSAEVLNSIFEPFFTTKRGKGSTGLGMNIVYNIIVQKLKGDIKITSEQGVGSTFVITLPENN
jgi:signal transduction histidine kinase